MVEATAGITERQQYWLDHIKAAAGSDGTMADYAARHERRHRAEVAHRRRCARYAPQKYSACRSL